jgi:hypothetical protein
MIQKFSLHLFILILLFCPLFVNAQCCAGGGGSPISGAMPQGVLSEGQFEVSTNVQYINSDKFYDKDKINTEKTFDSYSSIYEYLRIAYGVTGKFTLSIENGYYFNKKEVGLNKNPLSTFSSKGLGDLIIFPRYSILNNTNEKHHTEITLGLGLKFPLGSYNDSTAFVEPFSGDTYFITKPTAVQLSSGSQDFIFYAFFLNQFKIFDFQLSGNAFYIRKGYNANGEKLGDYSSIGLFAGKTFFNDFTTTLQVRFENVNRMAINESIILYGKPSNYYPEATGYKKIFITPQISYTIKKFTIYASTDIPVYQNLNTSKYYTQVGSKYQASIGLAYRFFNL